MDVETDVLEKIKAILRRDLKIGPDVVIEPEMPLVGGPTDLDSIDLLLLVSSLEKQFGIKIPNEAVGRAAFENVRTLARYVQINRETLKSDVAPSAAAAQGADWLARLPHGPEFRFVSAITEIVPGERAIGIWLVKGDEPFLRGHFPLNPVVPGVLIGEALAQTAGLAAAGERARGGMLAHMDLRFTETVRPPAAIELRAVVTAAAGPTRACEVVASVGGRVAAKGVLTIHYRD